MIDHKGSLKPRQTEKGEVWDLHFQVTRASDGKQVERKRVVVFVKDFPTKDLAYTEAERRKLYVITPGAKQGKLTFRTLAEFALQEWKKVPESKKRKPLAASTLEDRERILTNRLLPRFGEMEATRIKPHEIKSWLESVQDKEDRESTTIEKIRRVMNLVYKAAQAHDLIPRSDDANPLKHVHIQTTSEYEAILVEPQEAWAIICLMRPFERLLTVLVAVTGLRIGEVLALRWSNVDWDGNLIYVVSNWVRGVLGKPKSKASKKPVVVHVLVMALLKTWRETTKYAGGQDFIFASDRTHGKSPRVPNMLVEDHLRPAAAKAEFLVPAGHRFGFHNLRHGLASFMSEIKIDTKTIQDSLRWQDPRILLTTYAHSRLQTRRKAQNKFVAKMGLNESTGHLIQ
jgi:integrase